MSFPNLLATRKGRLAGFCALYVSEGLPQGFTATAVAIEFKRMGMTGEAIGSFAAFIMLPWAWKWIVGPFVDNLHFRRFGRRKQWIVGAQLGMLATLIAALLVFPKIETDPEGARTVIGLGLFTTILLINNIFSATQDVAIDALACNTLAEHERGLANGLMFGGAQAGAAIGGSGVLYLKGWLGFSFASLLAPLLLLCILSIVVFTFFERRLDDDASAPPAPFDVPPVTRALQEIASYLVIVGRTFFMTRRGFLGLLLAILPFGGMALSLVVSTVITPTLGMNDDEIATLGLVSSVVFVVCCMLGGFLSDRCGRRLTLAVFSAGTLLPTLWMGWQLHSAGWIYPVEAATDGAWPRHEALINAWWIAGLTYSVFQGLMYGIRTAFCMDIVEPRIAATQFTAYMAMLNLVTIYSYWWEGMAITPADHGGWGLTYLQIFLIDAGLGAVFLLVIPFVKPRR